MDSKNTSLYVLKIPVEIKEKLSNILKHSSGLKFSELATKFKKIYKLKLDLFFTADNELVLYVDHGNNYYNRDIEVDKLIDIGSETGCSEEYSVEFEHYLKKIDFAYEFIKKSEKTVSSSYHLKNYMEIKLHCPDTVLNKRDMMDNINDERTNKNYLINFFDKWTWKVDDIFPVFILNIYNPSKLWISFAPVEVFQKHLWQVYNQKTKSMCLRETRVGLNCVALISGLYYRVRVVGTDIQDNRCFKVFLYDFGSVSKVEVSQLYHLDEPFCKTPAFAVRAMLTNISSLDHQMWNQQVVARLTELTKDKPLIAQIAHVHARRKILEIDLLDTSIQKKGKIPTINYRLVCEGLAKIAWHPVTGTNDTSQFKLLQDLLYLHPPFEMIENWLAPSQVHLTEQLKLCVPLDVIFPAFYQFKNKE